MQARKRYVEVRVDRFINTDNNPYELILYLEKNSHRMIIEHPESKRFKTVDKSGIGQYLTAIVQETSWIPVPGFGDENVKIKETTTGIHSILPLFEEPYRRVTLGFEFDCTDHGIKEFVCDNFKIIPVNQNRINIFALLPLYKCYLHIVKNKRDIQFTGRTIYMRRGNEYYRFPYGNVHQSDLGNICYGSGRKSFENMSNFRQQFFGSLFNDHYGFGVDGCIINRNTWKLCEYDIEKIEEKMANPKYNRESLPFPEMIYYLSQKNPEEINMKHFIKLPKRPWEISI